MLVADVPSVIVEVMCLTPLTPAIASSTRFVTCVCNSAGAAPCWVTVTATIGTSTFGICVIGRAAKPNRPSASITTKNTIEGRGLRMAQAETFRRMLLAPASQSRRRILAPGGRRNPDGITGAQETSRPARPRCRR